MSAYFRFRSSRKSLFAYVVCIFISASHSVMANHDDLFPQRTNVEQLGKASVRFSNVSELEKDGNPLRFLNGNTETIRMWLMGEEGGIQAATGWRL